MQCQKRTDTTFACPLVGRRDLERRQAMHRDKLTRMGSSIDTRPPAPQPHLTLYGRDYAAKKRATTEAAFSDLKMIQSIAKTMTRKPDLPERKGPVSLNAETRKTEIFRIMKENHRLLDRLETLEPVVSTADLMKHNQERLRYTINVSHSKRLAGEYDDDTSKFRTQDKAKVEAMLRSVQARRARAQSASGSMSMPSLTPMAATDPGVLSGMAASPQPKRNSKPVVTKQLASTGGLGGSSSSKSSPPAVKKPDGTTGKSAPTEADQDLQKRDSKVSFSDGSLKEERDGNWERKGGPTPHPKSVPSELFYEDPEVKSAGEATPAAEAATPAAEAATPAAEAAASQESKTEATPAAATPVADADTPPAQEFDPEQSKPDTSSPQKVGLVASSAPESPDGKLGESYSQDYEEDFADDTQTSMSKAMNESKGGDEAFEASGTFEESKDG